MKTLQELMALKNSRAERIKALIAITDRALTDAENAEITQIREDADNLETQIRNAQFLADQKAAAAAREFEGRQGFHSGTSPNDPKDVKDIQKRFSITRAAQLAARTSGINGSNRSEDLALEQEMHEEGLNEARSANMPVTGKGILVPSMIQSRATAADAANAGNLIATNQMGTIEGYKPKLYVENLGATMHTGLTGINNIPIADFTAVSAFVGEGSAFTAVDATIRRPVATAKGLMSKLTNSWFLMAQAGPEADRILSMTLNRASQNALNANIVRRANSNSSHGIFGTADVVDVSAANGSAFSRDLLIDMINAAAKNNADGDRAGWLLSPTTREKAQKEKTDAGSGLFVWDNNMPNQLLGYQAETTTLVPVDFTKGSGTNLRGAAFGYWENLHLFNWALKELIVDRGSNDSGVVLKQVEFWDWIFANPKAFSIAYFTA